FSKPWLLIIRFNQYIKRDAEASLFYFMKFRKIMYSCVKFASMRLLVIILLLFSGVSFAQIKKQDRKIDRNIPVGSQRAHTNRAVDRFSAMDMMSQDSLNVNKIVTTAGDTVAPIAEYKIFNEYKGTSAFDTVLNIQK